MKVIYDVHPVFNSLASAIEPVVIMVHEFDNETSCMFTEAISRAHNTGQNVIPVIINSYGGDVYSLLSMIADIQSSELPVATIAKGKVMSSGAILAAFGCHGYRFADPESIYMFHEIALQASGKYHEVSSSVKHGNYINEKIYSELAYHCGKEDNYFIKKFSDQRNADWFLTSEEAKELGFVDHLTAPKMIVKASLKYEFELT
jgi:ATP-dependent Clp protease protease subunit